MIQKKGYKEPPGGALITAMFFNAESRERERERVGFYNRISGEEEEN